MTTSPAAAAAPAPILLQWALYGGGDGGGGGGDAGAGMDGAGSLRARGVEAHVRHETASCLPGDAGPASRLSCRRARFPRPCAPERVAHVTFVHGPRAALVLGPVAPAVGRRFPKLLARRMPIGVLH